MRRKIPSTAALAAFEAAARHQSFTLAADELALTQSAVGRQIANLEVFLGLKLFRRTRRGVALTPCGLQYSRTVRARLDDVERDTLQLMAGGAGGGSLELGVVPTFATHWLIPRLAGFRARHPGIDVHLHARTRPFLFGEAGVDAAIYAGTGGWPGTQADRLMPEPMVVVYAASLARQKKRLRAKDIAELPLIQMATRPYAWRQWFQAQGIECAADMAGPRMELFSMATQAAIEGLGVALVPAIFVADALQQGLLLASADRPFMSGLGYYLIHPEGEPASRELTVFRKWLLAEAGATIPGAATP